MAVKYKLPSGIETSESGFETKAAALTWGRDQEARIREGRWTDPNAGKITVSDWIDRWMTLQDVGLSTVETRKYLIRRFIRPSFGASELGSLTTEDITRWENSIPARTGVSRRVARDARAVLCTMLGDAAAAKPPLIPYNPAIRPRNRGRRTGRKLDRGPQRVWATPLQALLVAERAALLSGRDEDFTMVVTIAYTGLFSGGHPRAAEVRSSCLRSSEADLRTLSIAAGVVQGCCAACHRCRVAVLSWAMSSRFAARAAVRSWSRSSSWRRRSMACCSR